MRKTSKKPLDALFPRIRQEILSATLAGPDRSWTLSELARHLNARPSSLQRELASLVEAGILRRVETERNILYEAEPSCPIRSDLRALLLKTVGLVDVVRAALKSLQKKIEFAFIFGSVATGDERSGSDVDLVIVGRLGLADLAACLPRLEDRLGRPVNPRLYSPEEYAEKRARGDHFLDTVLKGNLLMVQGTHDDLAIAPR